MPAAQVFFTKVAHRGAENSKFPVKFPVSREFAWRRVRSALRRQPASHSAKDCWPYNPTSARQLRLSVNLLSVSILPKLNNLGAKSPIVSGPHLKYYRFWETAAGDRFDLHCMAVRQCYLLWSPTIRAKKRGFSMVQCMTGIAVARALRHQTNYE